MYSIRITHRGAVPGSVNLNQKEWNAVIRETWRSCGIYWVQRFRAKHFTTAGGTEYGYARRSGERGNIGPKGFRASYTGKKLKKWGHTRPLVYSGESERATRNARIHAVATRNKSGVDVIMRAPKLNFRNPKSPIVMRSELKTISGREAMELVRLHRRLTDSKLRAIRAVQSRNY